MPIRPEFADTFDALKAILEPYGRKMVVDADTSNSYSVESDKTGPNKKPLFFGAVRLGKAYVSFHLFPVYVKPELLRGASPELLRHMQGKSCFNFKQADAKLFRELARLTKEGHAFFRSRGWA